MSLLDVVTYAFVALLYVTLGLILLGFFNTFIYAIGCTAIVGVIVGTFLQVVTLEL